MSDSNSGGDGPCMLSIFALTVVNIASMSWIEERGTGRLAYRSDCTLAATTMLKHRLQDAALPVRKQRRTDVGQTIASQLLLNFDASLYDELILCIFSHLSWTDLSVMQSINRNWARLTTDNQVCTHIVSSGK